jgi:hypothetical protein
MFNLLMLAYGPLDHQETAVTPILDGIFIVIPIVLMLVVLLGAIGVAISALVNEEASTWSRLELFSLSSCYVMIGVFFFWNLFLWDDGPFIAYVWAYVAISFLFGTVIAVLRSICVPATLLFVVNLICLFGTVVV